MVGAPGAGYRGGASLSDEGVAVTSGLGGELGGCRCGGSPLHIDTWPGRATQLEMEMQALDSTAASMGVHLRSDLPVSCPARDAIEALLRVDPKDRLGGGGRGGAEVRSHPFFDCWGPGEWDDLFYKRMPAPIAAAMSSPRVSWTPYQSPLMPPLDFGAGGADSGFSISVEGSLGGVSGAAAAGAGRLIPSDCSDGDEMTQPSGNSSMRVSDEEEGGAGKGAVAAPSGGLPPEALRR